MTPERSTLAPGAWAYRALVEALPGVVAYLRAADETGTLLYVSPQVEAVLGFTPGEWASDLTLWLCRLHPADRDRVMAEYRESALTGAPFRSEYRVLHRDGETVWVRDEAALVRAEDGMGSLWRGLMLDVSDRKRAEQRLGEGLRMLRSAIDERRALMALLDGVQERERRRIAHDIHDDSIQVMSAVDVRLQALLAGERDPGRRRDLQELHETVSLAVDRLRLLIFELHPSPVEGGLGATVREYLRRWAPPELAVEVDDGLDGDPPPKVAALVFRIAKEALTNVRKHAGASRVRVSLGSVEGGVALEVADDGRGFDPGILGRPRPGHLGLPAMLERAEAAGGWCRVVTAPGAGTTVRCWIPVRAGEAGPLGGVGQRGRRT